MGGREGVLGGAGARSPRGASAIRVVSRSS